MTRIGIVGCGRIARDVHIPAMSSLRRASIAALCDSNPVSLQRASRLVPSAKTFASADEFLHAGIVDLVDICTPGFTHYELTKRSIESGHSVLVEKPVTLSVDQLKDIQSISKRHARPVCVLQTMRFHENVIELMNLSKRGALGNVKKVHCTYHGENVHNGPSWLSDEPKSGGLVYELAIHLLDLMAVLLGEPRRVIGLNSTYDHELEFTTSIEAIVEFEADKLGIVDLAHDTRLHSALYSQANVYCTGADAFLKFAPDYIRVGAGTVYPLHEMTSETKRLLTFSFQVLTRTYHSRRIQPHKKIIEGFLAALADGSPPPVTLDSVLNTMMLADMLRSAYQGLRTQNALDSANVRSQYSTVEQYPPVA